MGDRSTITVISPDSAPITIYSHWGGKMNVTAAENVLSRDISLDDGPRLTARLYAEFARLCGSTDGDLMKIISGPASAVWSDNPGVTVIAETGEYIVGDQPAVTLTFKKPKTRKRATQTESD